MRGIGVALIISRCGSSRPGRAACARSASRCATPKRCCSSMIASAEAARTRTCSWITACVPTTSAGLAAARPAPASRRAPCPCWLPVSQATVTPERRPSQPTSLRKCCSARISVGAISAHCQPASIATRRGERGDDRLAGADVALQQAVHRHARRARSARDLFGDAALRARERERQRGEQLLVQPAAPPARARARAGAARSRCAMQLRELLREQLLELQALPGRMRCGPRARPAPRPGGGWCRNASASRKRRQPGGSDARAAACSSRSARAPGRARPPCAGTACGSCDRGRVDRRQRRRQRRRRRDDLERRMHHLAAEEAAARLAAHAHALAGGERLLLRRIEVEEAQHQVAAVVGDLDDELAARPELRSRESVTTPSTCAVSPSCSVAIGTIRVSSS